MDSNKAGFGSIDEYIAVLSARHPGAPRSDAGDDPGRCA